MQTPSRANPFPNTKEAPLKTLLLSLIALAGLALITPTASALPSDEVSATARIESHGNTAERRRPRPRPRPVIIVR